ncbi:type VII secretion protein EssB [Streptococcus rifensis]
MEDNLKIGQHELKRSVDQQQVTLIQKRSDLQLQDLSRLSLLAFDHPLLLTQAISWDEDSVYYEFRLPETSVTWEELREQPISERLRILNNVLAFHELLDLELTFYLSPDNIHLDGNGIPRLFYRGLKNQQPPFDMTDLIFLRQVKSLIISQFSEHEFNTLYLGGLEAVNETAFIIQIKEAKDLEDLKDLLRREYTQTKSKENETYQRVPRTQFRLYRQLTFTLGALTVLFAIPLVYLGLIRGPFQDKMLQADTAFLKVDYSDVVTTLEDVQVGRLPKTQKYALAYSYVQLLDLSYESKQNILNNISLISDQKYLDYWIYDGRGEFDQSLDLARQLEDYQLIIYALDQKITQVRNDQSLDGETREEQLKTLEAEFEQYSKMRTDLLEQADSPEGSDLENTSESSNQNEE